MKYLHLLWAALFRSKTRTLLTLLSVVAAFLLFGMLDSVRVAFNSGANVAGANRADRDLAPVDHAAAAVQPRCRRSSRRPGVKRSSYAAWFGGIYQDPKNFFPNFAVGPGYLDAVPGVSCCRADQRKAFEADRTGAVVGESLAKQFGWKVGDTIPLQATIFPTKGSNDWPFELVGIFERRGREARGRGAAAAVPLELLRRGQRLRQGPASAGTSSQLDDAGQADRRSRKAIDALSANSTTRPRPRPRRRSTRRSPSRSATSA